jgi:hypothetical protein
VNAAAENHPALVFAWDRRGRRKWALTGFLLGSFLLHALCFYAFQIIYPPAVALLPPPGRVSLIAPNTDEGRVLLRWLEAEDPALASTTQTLAEAKLFTMPTIQHAPSYLTHEPQLRDIPALAADLRVPSAQPPAPVERPHPQVPVAAKIVPTTVRFSPELEALGPLESPPAKFAASGHESPQPAEFRVAVNENGEVRYSFVEVSSGDPALDEQARKYLALCRFPAIRDSPSSILPSLTWGTAIVEWGNDILAPPPKNPETKSP